MATSILIAAFGFYPEQHGIAQAAYRQALALHGLGYQVMVITRNLSNEVFPFQLIAVEKKEEYQSLLKSSNAQVFFFHGWHNWVSDWALAAFPVKGKTVLVSHGTNFNVRLGGWKGMLFWLWKRLEAARFPNKMVQFDHFVFLSDKLDNQRMSDLLLVKKREMSNYSIIPNGARTDFVKAQTHGFCLQNNIAHTRILLCVSNYHYAKGQRELMDWFIDLALPDTALVLIGSTFNAFSDQLQKQAKQHLNKSVFLFEKLNQKELNEAYNAATVFVSATYTEVQPLMLLDAMSVGLPFLCRDVGTVDDLEGGMCFKTRKGFAAAIQLLLKGPLLRQTLGKQGQKAVEDKYNWNNIAWQYNYLIKKLIR